MDLATYLDGGVQDIIETMGKFYLSHPRGLAFIAGEGLNVAEVGLEGALRSRFFERVQAIEASHATEHEGGCTLFLHADEVEVAIARL